MTEQKRTIRLVLFDMDETLLDSAKRIRPGSVQAIRRGQEQGLLFAFGTGRCISEMMIYPEVFQDIRYGSCESGSLIYDFAEHRILSREVFDRSTAEAVLAAAGQEDLMIQLETDGQGTVAAEDIPRMEYYHYGRYRGLYEQTARKVPDIRATARAQIESIEKFNLFHTSAEGRARTRTRLEGLPLELVDGENTLLEISPKGVCKGLGLRRLCELFGLTPAECAAVGDADNDISMFREAGLSIAMGNANDAAKAAADVIVADNDHDGIAEAVELCLRSRR